MAFKKTWIQEDLPVVYSQIPVNQRWEIRKLYQEKQQGKCLYCDKSLNHSPAQHVTRMQIDWSLFPKGFLNHPIHLHHDHTSGLTIGAVHAYCNAVLWQYENE